MHLSSVTTWKGSFNELQIKRLFSVFQLLPIHHQSKMNQNVYSMELFLMKTSLPHTWGPHPTKGLRKTSLPLPPFSINTYAQSKCFRRLNFDCAGFKYGTPQPGEKRKLYYFILLEQINKHKAARSLMMNDLAAAPRDNDKSLSLELLRWSLFASPGR